MDPCVPLNRIIVYSTEIEPCTALEVDFTKSMNGIVCKVAALPVKVLVRNSS